MNNLNFISYLWSITFTSLYLRRITPISNIQVEKLTSALARFSTPTFTRKQISYDKFVGLEPENLYTSNDLTPCFKKHWKNVSPNEVCLVAQLLILQKHENMIEET